MKDDRRLIGTALLGAALAATASTDQARAQDPMPPMPPLVTGSLDFGSSDLLPPPPILPAGTVPMPEPAVPFAVPPPAPIQVPHAGPAHVHRPGPIRRAFHHIGFTIKDRMVGEHERFVEPPLGWSVNRNLGAQQARGELHRFTLYRTDFLWGTDQLTPDGLRRLGRMVANWHCYPVLVVEIDPNRPGLAEARRLAVMELAASNGAPFDPDRLIVGGSPFLGGRGDLSEIYDGVLIDRSLRAPTTYPLNPIPNADFQN